MLKTVFYKRKDFLAGLLFVFFGIFAVVSAGDYPLGTLRRMGPAYFPSILGGVLALLGFIIAARSLWAGGETVRSRTLRPLIMILGAVAGFALLLKPLGLVLASLVLILISRLGGWEFRWRETAFLYLVLIFMVVVLFVYGLGLQFNIWPA
jgi:putative tricarboxylic transport membrane protein